MSDLDDLLAKGYAAAGFGDEPAPKPAPSMDTDVAALLGRTPASPDRTPAPPDDARADVAALTGKSPAPAPAPGFAERVGDAVKYGVNLASTAAGDLESVLNKEGLIRDPKTNDWIVDPQAEVEDARPWYKKAAGAIGDVIEEGVVDWGARKGREMVEALPAAISGFGHGVTGGLAPNIVAQGQNELAQLSPKQFSPTSAREVQVEHEKRADEHPAGDFVGDVLGSAALGAATGPGAGTSAIAGQLGGRGAQTAARIGGNTANSLAQYFARNITNTSADEPWKKRISTGVQEAVDNPVGLGAAAALPVALEGAERGLGAIARGTSNAAKDAFSHLILPPDERAKLIAIGGGKDAVRELMADVQHEGILGGLVPTANSVQTRAGTVAAKAGQKVGDMLDDILVAAKSAGSTADTSKLKIELLKAANQLRGGSFRLAKAEEIKALEDTIAMIESFETSPNKVQLETAISALKDFQKHTKYDPTVKPRTGVEQAINMTGWKGLKDSTTDTFRDMEAQGHLPAGTTDKYKTVQKSFHTAKSVHHPAARVAERVAQARGTDPSNLLGAAILGGQFGAPAAVGVSLGGIPHGLGGRALQVVSGLAKSGNILSEIGNKLRVPSGLAGQAAAYAKEANEEARQQVRKTRADRERRARASNELEKALRDKLR